jgi:hypothetical protein
MSAPVLYFGSRRLKLTESVGCKVSREQCVRAGDFCFAELDKKRVVIIVCPFCEKQSIADGHEIVREHPLTLSPVLECPTGCRYRICDGKVVAA